MQAELQVRHTTGLGPPLAEPGNLTCTPAVMCAVPMPTVLLLGLQRRLVMTAQECQEMRLLAAPTATWHWLHCTPSWRYLQQLRPTR